MSKTDNDAGKVGPSQKSARMVGLFMAAALLVSSGCGFNQPRYSQQPEHTHVDNDKDGYCDFDGQPMEQSSTGFFRSRYYNTPIFGRTYSDHVGTAAGGTPSGKTPAAGVSSGAKGGIGKSFGVSG